jgi:hypothetical protein
VYAGTFCDNPIDCSYLKTCIEFAKTNAKDNKQTAFLTYLESSNTINDAADRNQCGRAKQYFGFDEDDPDEVKICDEIRRLRETQDFQTLDEFANFVVDTNGGSGGGSGSGSGEYLTAALPGMWI